MNKCKAIIGIVVCLVFLAGLVCAVITGAKHQLFWVVIILAFLIGFIREYIHIKKQ